MNTKKELELVPLSVSMGWKVDANHFYQINIDELEEGKWYPFVEDILMMTNENYRLTIDLGWYPEGEEDGCFRLLLLPWEKPTKAYMSAKKTIKRGISDENFLYELKENINVLWSNPICTCEGKTWQEIQTKLNKILKKY